MKKRFLSTLFLLSLVFLACVVPEKNVQAEDVDEVDIGGITLNSTYPYLPSTPFTRFADPGPGHRSDHYALFDSESHTLTLHDFHLDGFESFISETYGISFDFDINIILEGDNSVICSNETRDAYAIYSESDDKITFSGSGSLRAIAKCEGDQSGEGIIAPYITIDSGSIYAEGSSCGIEADNDITINGGSVEAYCQGSPEFNIAMMAGGDNAGIININSGSILSPQGGQVGSYSQAPANIKYVLDASGNIADHVIIGSTSQDSKGSAVTGKACEHNYEWIVENEPTEDETGLFVEKCTKCGNIRATQVIPAIKDDYGRCMYERTKQILRAKSGQTITVDIGYWDSIPKSFFEALANKRDITLKVKFMYKGKLYEFTVAPGQTIDTSCDYYGPEKLIELYGAKEVITK